MSRALIEKARRLLEKEVGTIHRSMQGRMRFALAFPGPYRLAMSSLGYQIVYGLLNSMPDVTCERVVLPDPSDLIEFRRSGTRLFTLESQSPVTDFDVLAFSVSFEANYSNVALMLDLSGMPVFAADRDESHPLVLAGGPCATFNPEPLADLIDAFAIGDAEGLVADLVQALELTGGKDRVEMLAALTEVQGIYVPRFYSPRYGADGTPSGIDVTSPAPSRVTRRLAMNLDDYGSLSLIVTPEAEFSGMLLAEAMRGCKRQCRFCVSGYAGLPPRPRKIPQLPTGARVGLVGSAVFDHPEAQAICEQFTEEGREYSLSSIRVESLTPELARMMFRAGQQTMTIAPEAGTETLRRAINKPTTDAEILEASDMASEAGFRRLKLYYMVGLPCETEEDTIAVAELTNEIASRHPLIKLQVSASCFVPKPWTPFQWCGMAPMKELTRKLAVIRKRLSGDRRIEFSTESPRESYVQAWLARGDRSVGKVVAKAGLEGISYAKAATELGIDTDFFATRPRSKDETFPWDHIDLLVTKDYLRKELRNAIDGKVTANCSVGACHRCGVC